MICRHGFYKTALALTWLTWISAHSADPVAAQRSAQRSAIGPGDLCQVAVTLADLRRKPVPAVRQLEPRGRYPIDPLQETQVLYGEEVRVGEVRGEWCRVEAIEQLEFSSGQRWEGYPGWLPARVLAARLPELQPTAVVVAPYADLRAAPAPAAAVVDQVPIGARLQIERHAEGWACVRRPAASSGWIQDTEIQLMATLPTGGPDLRQSIVQTAVRFLGQPYLWGGRSWHKDSASGPATGVDCSGLVHLSYRINGVAIPRDAHDQSLRARPIRPEEIEPADLIFLAHIDKPERVYHVLMSMGGDAAIEAVSDANVVRRITLTDRLGVPLRELAATGRAERLVVRLGRLLPD